MFFSSPVVHTAFFGDIHSDPNVNDTVNKLIAKYNIDNANKAFHTILPNGGIYGEYSFDSAFPTDTCNKNMFTVVVGVKLKTKQSKSELESKLNSLHFTPCTATLSCLKPTRDHFHDKTSWTAGLSDLKSNYNHVALYETPGKNQWDDQREYYAVVSATPHIGSELKTLLAGKTTVDVLHSLEYQEASLMSVRNAKRMLFEVCRHLEATKDLKISKDLRSTPSTDPHEPIPLLVEPDFLNATNQAVIVSNGLHEAALILENCVLPYESANITEKNIVRFGDFRNGLQLYKPSNKVDMEVAPFYHKQSQNSFPITQAFSDCIVGKAQDLPMFEKETQDIPLILEKKLDFVRAHLAF